MISKLRSLVSRAWFGTVNDGTPIQEVQAQYKGLRRINDEVRLLQPFGFRAVPPVGSEAILFAVGGATDDAVAVGAFSYEDAPPLGSPPKAVGLYALGTFRVYLDPESGQLVLCGEAEDGRSAADAVAVAGATKAELEALQATVDSLVTAYNAHIHVTTATIGGGGTPGVIAPTTSVATAPAAVGPLASPHVRLPADTE